MTKFREPITFHRALTTVAAKIGWDRCAAICGLGERAVRNWSDPDTDTEIRLIDARRLDQAYLAAGGDHPPFHRTYALQLGLELREPATAPTITTAAAHIAKEGGEAIAAMLDAAARASGEAARRKARREVREAIEALGTGLDALGDGD
jgi:hypothetical protein